jgi:hypothetical protein
MWKYVNYIKYASYYEISLSCLLVLVFEFDAVNAVGRIMLALIFNTKNTEKCKVSSTALDIWNT